MNSWFDLLEVIKVLNIKGKYEKKYLMNHEFTKLTSKKNKRKVLNETIK